MKIVIDARESGTSTGRYVDKLVEHLHQLKPDFQIVVLTKTPRLQFMKKQAPDFEVIKSDFKEFTFSEQLGFLRQLNKLKADLVHFTMTQQPVRYKGRAVTTIHDLTTARFNNPGKNPAVFKSKQLVYKRVIKQVAKQSVRIITPSQFVKDDLVKFTKIDPDKIKVIHEAADAVAGPAQAINNLEGKKFLLYVGRPTPHKNLERAVEAYGQALASHPDLLLVLAGKTDGNYRRLQKFAKLAGLNKNLIFTDFVSESQLKWLYQNATAYIFPSLSEGFGLPGLEAMVYGLPVLSSNATCLPEIYGPAALYFDPKNVGDIAAKINQLLDDESLAKKLAAAGGRQVSRYSWENTAAKTLAIYNKILRLA